MITINRENSECKKEELIRLCQEATQELKKAYAMETRKLGKEVDFAEMRVAKLRDCLIDQIRSETTSGGSSPWKPVLNQVNTALSFIVGVEYPAMGIHRNLLEQGLEVLKKVQKEVEQIAK